MGRVHERVTITDPQTGRHITIAVEFSSSRPNQQQLDAAVYLTSQLYALRDSTYGQSLAEKVTHTHCAVVPELIQRARACVSLNALSPGCQLHEHIFQVRLLDG